MSVQDYRRPTIITYSNKKGRQRVAIQMDREFALEVALGSQLGYDLLDVLRDVIEKKITDEEMQNG